MKNFSAKEIFKLVDALVGNVEAVGETSADDIALKRLEVLISVTDMCLDKIVGASHTSNRPEYSMREVGMTALRYLAESSEWFDEHRQRWRNVTGKWDEIDCSEWEE